MYNVTLDLFVQPWLSWKSDKCYLWACVCSLRYPVYSVHAPYCQSVAYRALQYFSTCLITQHNFWKKFSEHRMCVLIFSPAFVWNISHSKKNLVRYDQKCILVFMLNTCYYYEILMKLECSWHIFKKYSNIEFHENLCIGSWVVPCRWMDRQTDMMKLIVAFWNFVNAPKIYLFNSLI